MPHNSVTRDGDLIIINTDDADARALRRAVEMGHAHRIYAGIYTRNVDAPADATVMRNWAAIVGHILPAAVLAFRSAAEHRPVDGVLCVGAAGVARSPYPA